jgi:hypothetical protein
LRLSGCLIFLSLLPASGGNGHKNEK